MKRQEEKDMPLFEESKEDCDFRKVLRKFVAKEVTPYVIEWRPNVGSQDFLNLSSF